MTVQAKGPDLQLTAIMGACIAVSLLVLGWGILGIAALIIEGEALPVETWGGMLGFFVITFAVGLFIALLTAFPLGCLYGRLILCHWPPSIGAAALAGSLTGATLGGLVSSLDSGGFRQMWQPVSLFTVLGAFSGTGAFWFARRHAGHHSSV